MSQFMISRAEADLTDCGGIRLLDSKYNRELLLSVINDYFPNTDNNIWIIEDIHDYCNEAQESKSFVNSKLYYILDKLYDVCDYMVLWYGSEYDDLDEVYSKKGLFELN